MSSAWGATVQQSQFGRALPAWASRLASLALASFVVVGCVPALDQTPPTPSPLLLPSDGPSLPAGLSEDEIQEWSAFRQFWGLRSDPAWTISVAQDPSADLAMDVPLLPWELSQIVDLDLSAQDLVLRLENYGSRYPQDFAGVFIDGPIVVVRFAHNFRAHLAVVGPRFAEAKRVRVEQARYSLEELEQIARQVAAKRSLVDAAGVTFYSADVDVINNKVRVRFQGDPGRDDEVRAALGNADWLRLEPYNLGS